MKVKTLYGNYVVGTDIPAGTFDFIVGAASADITIRKYNGFVQEYFLARNGGPLDVRVNLEDGDRVEFPDPVIVQKAEMIEFE